MVDALNFASSALRTAGTRQNAYANNVANSLTPGFRSQRVDATSISTGGVRVGAIRADGSSGGLEVTDRGLDLAVSGSGFFAVETPAGTRYTRTASFSTDAGGNIVDAEGNRLAPGLTVPNGAASIAVAGDGTVTAHFSDGTARTVGQVDLVDFANPGGLIREGGNLFSVGPNSGLPVAATGGTIVSGFLEGSNVDIASQIVGQIENSAFFRANLATIKVERDLLGELMNIVG